MASQCDPNVLPVTESLPIATDITYGLISGNNVSDAAMVSCCSPNPVNLVNECVLWCELPERYLNATTSSTNSLLSEFGRCLKRSDEGGPMAFIVGAHMSSATASKPARWMLL
ncbi:hypothetical protein B0H66DRAFT_206639 [Apodospora peruviana]|uniref:Uncharacterized protein n=1 Tax=Apodospora peruviana TaxID=516989 RepID=A0AAE0ICP3_9PEZI|nr:hypothetical protein B0H66DRAFT_206639 [Apodospora peruviana]